MPPRSWPGWRNSAQRDSGLLLKRFAARRASGCLHGSAHLFFFKPNLKTEKSKDASASTDYFEILNVTHETLWELKEEDLR